MLSFRFVWIFLVFWVFWVPDPDLIPESRARVWNPKNPKNPK